MKTLALLLLTLIAGCGASAPTILKTTIGGLWGSCQLAPADLPRGLAAFCDRVAELAPGVMNQLGAGDAELPADVAAREVTITIGGE